MIDTRWVLPSRASLVSVGTCGRSAWKAVAFSTSSTTYSTMTSPPSPTTATREKRTPVAASIAALCGTAAPGSARPRSAPTALTM